MSKSFTKKGAVSSQNVCVERCVGRVRIGHSRSDVLTRIEAAELVADMSMLTDQPSPALLGRNTIFGRTRNRQDNAGRYVVTATCLISRTVVGHVLAEPVRKKDESFGMFPQVGKFLRKNALFERGALVVAPSHRGSGICEMMYEELWKLLDKHAPKNYCVVSSTWEGSPSHRWHTKNSVFLGWKNPSGVTETVGERLAVFCPPRTLPAMKQKR